MLQSGNLNNQHIFKSPIQCQDKHPVEVENEAEKGITPNPHREGQKHHPDNSNISGAVEKNHQVHQGEILDLRKQDVNPIPYNTCEGAIKSLV